MDKFKLAHEYALKQMESLSENSTMQSLVSVAWQYADAMQAEAEERINKERPDILCEVDWSQAPEDATHYVSFGDGLSYWHKSEKLECFDIAPSFGIASLFIMERPHGF